MKGVYYQYHPNQKVTNSFIFSRRPVSLLAAPHILHRMLHCQSFIVFPTLDDPTGVFIAH